MTHKYLRGAEKARRDQEIIQLYKNNLTLVQVSERCLIAPTTVLQILVNNGIERRAPGKQKFKRGRTLEEKFWLRVDKSGGEDACWIWIGTRNKQGYGRLKENKKYLLAHRLSFRFSNQKEAENCVLHHCDNPPCVNPKHLYDGTPQDNINDMMSRRRDNWLNALKQVREKDPSKFRHPTLTESQVREIKTRIHNGEKVAHIAKDYPVTCNAIARIKSGKTWKHLTI